MSDSTNASYINEKGILHYKAGEFDEAFSCWEKSANLGNPSAMFELGVIYLDGNCVEKNISKARVWFENAARAGHKNADKQLEKLNSGEIGIAVPVNNDKLNHCTKKSYSVFRFGDYEWIELGMQNTKSICLSKDVIGVRRYNETIENVTWETCNLRKWLNSNFINGFTTNEQKKILETEIHNADNLIYATVGGNTTKDRFFLLSVNEVLEYFGDDGSLDDAKSIDLLTANRYDEARRAVLNMTQKQLEEAADHSKLDYSKINKREFIGWWLRTPGRENDKAMRINCNGAIRAHGRVVNCNLNGVRPAFWANTEEIKRQL